ncbi:hypothetical protein Droror1_Dr00014432 [Drosera rotundifolia]
MVGSKMERGSDFDSDLCLQTNESKMEQGVSQPVLECSIICSTVFDHIELRLRWVPGIECDMLECSIICSTLIRFAFRIIELGWDLLLIYFNLVFLFALRVVLFSRLYTSFDELAAD